MARIGLEFLLNTGGESEGLSDPGVENFRDKPFTAVARETGQNSRDARQDHTKPVRLTFDVLSMSSDDFPSIAAFRGGRHDFASRRLTGPRTRRRRGSMGYELFFPPNSMPYDTGFTVWRHSDQIVVENKSS